MDQQALIPKQWFCPITQELMIQPTIAADGFSYERKAIETWLQKSKISPMTGADLPNDNLIPNHALRITITQFREKNSGKIELKKPGVMAEHGKNQIPKISFQTDAISQESNYYVRCQIVPPPAPANTRRPCTVICVIDVSQSMDTDSVLGGRDVESHGFSRLDLVKHSMNTMIEFMGDNDEMAVIPFNNAARVAVPLTKTTTPNKNIIKNAVKGLRASGTTNIWDGLKTSLELLKQNFRRVQGRNVFVVLLTDGEPNLNPPRGIVPTLKKFIQIENIPTPNIHAFGYGYELDTPLLASIAETGFGTCTYIPDCSMVGTAFVNFMSTALATVTNRLKLKFINMHPEAQLQGVIGFNRNKQNQYDLGVLQFGQSRQFFMKFDERVAMGGFDKLCDIQICYDNSMEEILFPVHVFHHAEKPIQMRDSLIKIKYLNLLKKLAVQNKKNLKKCFEDVSQFYTMIEKENKVQPSQLTKVLLKQLKNEDSENQGQVAKAFEREQWFEKWGRHYIPSLYLAHLMQTCTNFKDPALQMYGGANFEENRNNLDSIFIKMAPPEPSAKKVENLVYKPVPIDMQDYYNEWGGCIYLDCSVKMADGTQKKISELKRGDKVFGGGIVRCMLKGNVFNFIQMVQIGQLLITPWHPVRINGEWYFPCQAPNAKTIETFVQSYYTFVLEGSHSLICQEIQCIGVGHGLEDNPVIAHEYFGKTILTDLSKSKHWQAGLITITGQERDPLTKKIKNLQFDE